MDLFDKTMGGIQKALDLRFKRHLVLGSNIANASTPNFQAREVDFAGELQRAFGDNSGAIKKTDSRHMDLSSSEAAHVVIDNKGAMRDDGNNVDLDIAMGKLGSNSDSYSSATNYMSIKLRLLRMVANGRGGV